MRPSGQGSMLYSNCKISVEGDKDIPAVKIGVVWLRIRREARDATFGSIV